MNHIWNNKNPDRQFVIGTHAPMPPSTGSAACPKCCGTKIIAVTICYADTGRAVIPSSDEVDPDFVCTECGYWWDA